MELNKYIDHTLLKQDATRAEIERLCAEAKAFEFASVCVNPSWVSFASRELQGTDVAVCTVIGFPLGATTTETKAFETKFAVEQGATELDMVIHIGHLKEKQYEYVQQDIAAVVDAAAGLCVKVIIETCLLTDEEKVIACKLAVEAGAHFVKTSTGFSTGGATRADIELMSQAVAGRAQVKASGGVRDAATAKEMIAAGATRIGTSNGIAIVEGTEAQAAY